MLPGAINLTIGEVHCASRKAFPRKGFQKVPVEKLLQPAEVTCLLVLES